MDVCFFVERGVVFLVLMNVMMCGWIFDSYGGGNCLFLIIIDYLLKMEWVLIVKNKLFSVFVCIVKVFYYFNILFYIIYVMLKLFVKFFCCGDLVVF